MKENTLTKSKLFLELANPDEQGTSRWVDTQEFVGKYYSLRFGNGGDWCRGSSWIAKNYRLEKRKDPKKSNKIIAIRLNGFNDDERFSQAIRNDIKNKISQEECCVLGVKGFSENTTIEVDHKNGRKNDPRVSNLVTQKETDFQPLCKACNDIKRQICKRCKETGIRFDGKKIPRSYNFLLCWK